MKNRIKEIRNTKGISQAEFVKAVGISRQSISAIENGRTVPSLDIAFDIAKALDERIEDVFYKES